MDLTAIKKLAYELMGNKRSHDWKEKGNKYLHGERVASLVLKLRKQLLPGDDSHDDILVVAAWLHDIANGVAGHESKGAKKLRHALTGYCSETELDTICEIITFHDDRNSGYDSYSDYIKLHQDADHLDHFGSYEVWTHFLYAVPHELNILDVLDYFKNVRPTEDEKYLSELNFEVSKNIYNEKREFLQNFIDRFGVECTGGIWNEERFFEGATKI
ncbi:MAG: HD domain-containing protein [Saccharofermentanales bacterium]